MFRISFYVSILFSPTVSRTPKIQKLGKDCVGRASGVI